MKKKLCLILSLVLCLSVFATPVAYAQSMENNTAQDVVMVDIPVVDVNGNTICTVATPERVAVAILSGAYITYLGVKVLVYQAAVWICLNPDLVYNVITLLTHGFDLIQNEIGKQLVRADHDGTSYVSARTSSGDDCFPVGGGIWACRLSL